MNKKCALGIIFKVPESGKVKTRLSAQIGKEAALQAYTEMLNETIRVVSNETSNVSNHPVKWDVYGFYDGILIERKSRRAEVQKDYRTSELRNFSIKIKLIPQQGRDLGEKMSNAIKWLFENRYDRVVLIGADSPDMPLCYIEDAFLKLNSYELVIGPTEDGGYYLIGTSMPLEVIFKDIEWGGEGVLKETIAIAQREDIRYFLLPMWYDIDDIENLRQWKN